MTEKNAAPATLDKRVPAFLIDMVPAGLVQALLMVLFIMHPLMQKQIHGNQVMARNLFITAIAMIFMVFRDVFGGRSIGKRIMKLRVVPTGEGQETASAGALILRNIFVIIWPIEALLLLSGKDRLGDKVAKTRVVEMKGIA
jgi:uncharacterized RDD family membrane protein YckC